jgi:hypothetical protein
MSHWISCQDIARHWTYFQEYRITTALVFNAKGNATKEHQAVEKTADDDKGQSFIKQKAQENAKPCSDSPSTALSTRNNECPVTGLHCEPIANMAVHLHGFW